MTTSVARRALLASSAAALLPWRARAAGQRVTLFLFPGVTTDAWRKLYVQPFTARTGIEVRIANPPGDPIVWLKTRAKEFSVTIGNPTVLNQYRDGDVQGLDPAEFPVLKDIPAEFQSIAPDGKIVGMPIYFQFYGIAVNTDVAKVSDFTSWKDLADPKWKGRVGVGNYADMYELPWFSRMLGAPATETGPAMDLYKSILTNCLTIPRNLVQANQLLRSGEIAAMPYYSGQVWTMQSQGVKNVVITVPREGAMILPYLLAIPKDAAAMSEAKQFLAFCGAAPAADKIAETLGYLPVNRTVPFPSSVERVLGYGKDELMKRLVSLDWTQINANMGRLSGVVQKVNAGQR